MRIAEWLPCMNAYRLYDTKNPAQAIAYLDDAGLPQAKEEADARGIKLQIEEKEA